jgi:hypothetical protein
VGPSAQAAGITQTGGSDCGPEGRGFESPRLPHSNPQLTGRFAPDGGHWTSFSGGSVLRAAAARPSSAADPAAGPPASAGSRPHGLAGLEVLGDLRQLVGQGVEHPGRAVTGNRSLRKATYTGAPAGDIVTMVRAARKTPYRAISA